MCQSLGKTRKHVLALESGLVFDIRVENKGIDGKKKILRNSSCTCHPEKQCPRETLPTVYSGPIWRRLSENLFLQMEAMSTNFLH